MTTVYVTVPRDQAAEIATTLVEQRLAACVNRFDCRSTFRWNEEVTETDETALLVKTTAERYDAVEQKVKELHPYEVPCIERFETDDVNDACAEWLERAIK